MLGVCSKDISFENFQIHIVLKWIRNQGQSGDDFDLELQLGFYNKNSCLKFVVKTFHLKILKFT